MMNFDIRTAALGALAILGAACSSPAEGGPAPTPAATGGAELHTCYRVNIKVDSRTQVATFSATLGPLASEALRPGGIVLSFPERFAFVTLPPRFAKEPVATANGRALSLPEQLDDFTFRVDPAGARQLELTWSIALDQREEPEVIAGNDGYEHSFVEPNCGMLFTAELIPLPQLDLREVEVGVSGEFAGSTTAPWPMDILSERDATVWNPSPMELSNDILLLGEGWTTVNAEAAGLTAKFALAPGNAWLFPLIKERLIPIVQAEVDLFGWTPRETFLFAFGPSAGTPGYGGSPKLGSMTLYASADLPPDVAAQSVAHLIAHEFHHLWAHGSVQPTDDLRFVGEGYTDYYAYLVPWRLGMISDATMHRTLESRLTAGAQALKKYGRSLTAAGGPEFFAGREAYDACYAAGLAMALWTDLALRKNGQAEGLDELMREWYRPPPDQGKARGSRSVTLDDWISHLSTRLSPRQIERFSAVVSSTEPIDWESLFDEVDLIVEWADSSLRISPSCLPRLR